MDEILKHYEKLAQENVTSNHDSEGREDTYMNNNKGSQHSNMKEYIINRIPASCEQEENQKQIPIHRNREKPEENTKTQTHYGRVSRKLDSLTYY